MDDFQRQRFILVYRHYLQGKAIIRDRNYTSYIQQALHGLFKEADLTIERRMEFDSLRSNIEASYHFDMEALKPEHMDFIRPGIHDFILNEYRSIKGIRPPKPFDPIPQSNLCLEVYP